MKNICIVGLFASSVLLVFFWSTRWSKNEYIEKQPQIPIKQTLQDFSKPRETTKPTHNTDASNIPSLEDNHVKELNYDDINNELAEKKNFIKNSNLINRLNENVATPEERKDAFQLFERTTALGIEKVERDLAAMQDDFEAALAISKNRLSEVARLLDAIK